MQILSDEQIIEEYHETNSSTDTQIQRLRRVSQAQLEQDKVGLKKLFEELEQSCPHDKERYLRKNKAECPICRRQLKMEYGL